MKAASGIHNYLSLVKFSHTVFAMPFALVGYFSAVELGGGSFRWAVLGLVVLCMVLARNAAMGFNRWADRALDGRNPRTRGREIPSGRVRPAAALAFVIANALLFINATWYINRLVFWLSPVALLVVLGYSYTKRFTTLCHFILGVGLSLAPLGAWLAVTAGFAWLPVLYSLLVLFWVSGFDIIFSLQDDDVDKELRLYSLPARIGRANALLVSRSVHVLAMCFAVAAGLVSGAGAIYWAGAVIFAGLLAYQQSLVRPTDLSRLNMAFFTMNGMASVVFAIFVITDLYFSV